jgi:hypothetical protein
MAHRLLTRAGEGNRTLVFSLEGYCSTIELHPHYDSNPARTWAIKPNPSLMGGAGFEPAKALPTDLQSVPFDHSGNPPQTDIFRASGGIRTHDRLITNQLLYQLSYAGWQNNSGHAPPA